MGVFHTGFVFKWIRHVLAKGSSISEIINDLAGFMKTSLCPGIAKLCSSTELQLTVVFKCNDQMSYGRVNAMLSLRKREFRCGALVRA